MARTPANKLSEMTSIAASTPLLIKKTVGTMLFFREQNIERHGIF